jgi:hypothetical protein
LEPNPSSLLLGSISLVGSEWVDVELIFAVTHRVAKLKKKINVIKYYDALEMRLQVLLNTKFDLTECII